MGLCLYNAMISFMFQVWYGLMGFLKSGFFTNRLLKIVYNTCILLKTARSLNSFYVVS